MFCNPCSFRKPVFVLYSVLPHEQQVYRKYERCDLLNNKTKICVQRSLISEVVNCGFSDIVSDTTSLISIKFYDVGLISMLVLRRLFVFRKQCKQHKSVGIVIESGLPRFSALALTSYLCAGFECGAGECSELLLCRRIVGSRDTKDALFLNDALITRLSNIHNTHHRHLPLFEHSTSYFPTAKCDQ